MRSIHSRLWISITGLILLILLLTLMFQVVLLPRFYYIRHESRLIKQSEELSHDLSMAHFNEKRPLFDEKIDQFAVENKSIVSVLNTNGEIIYFNAPDELTPDEPRINIKMQFEKLLMMESQILIKPTSNRTEMIKKFIEPINNTIYLISIPIIENQKIVGQLILLSPLPIIDDTIELIAYQLIPVSILALLIGGLLAKILAKKFSDPIHEITIAAQSIAEGKNDIYVSVLSEDEIGDLGSAINHMAEGLKDVERLRTELIGNTSHELKTPIALIKGYSMMMKEIKDESDNFDDYLDIITDESDRLTTMIEDMLLLSKMQTKNEILTVREVDIEHLSSDVCKKLSLFAKGKMVKLHIEKPLTTTMINGDEKKMFQVLYNLVHNAIKFSEEDSQVVLRIEKSSESVRIMIIDNGIGINKKDLPLVWERFYKSNHKGRVFHKGTGLGLSIVKSILDKHSFEYGIESKIDIGTVIWIHIKSQLEC